MPQLARVFAMSVVMATGIFGSAALAAPAMAADLRETIDGITETAPQPCQGGGNCCSNHPDKPACSGAVDCAVNPNDPACEPAL